MKLMKVAYLPVLSPLISTWENCGLISSPNLQTAQALQLKYGCRQVGSAKENPNEK